MAAGLAPVGAGLHGGTLTAFFRMNSEAARAISPTVQEGTSAPQPWLSLDTSSW